MKNFYFLILIVLALGLTTCSQAQSNTQPQSNSQSQSNSQVSSKLFSTMTEKEKADFVARKIDEITIKISSKKYPFNADFQALVTNYLNSYTKRVGSTVKNRPFGEDLNFVMQRGSEYAPTINAVFDKNGVARISGLYLAMIESEFNNNLVSPTGGSGIFSLIADLAQKYGMTKKDLTDLSKSAEITARQIIENQKKFDSNNMKEFLAILSHNRGTKKIVDDLNRKMMDDYQACSICGMTENATSLDEQFQSEAVKYIPKFLAAAIIGENPKDFALSTKPLSTLGVETSQSLSENNSELNVSPDFWKRQSNKSLEVRNAPVGLSLKGVMIPSELIGFDGKQSSTLKEQNFVADMLTEIEKNGKIDALHETGPNAIFHVFVL